jgi:hypothetical protein
MQRISAIPSGATPPHRLSFPKMPKNENRRDAQPQTEALAVSAKISISPRNDTTPTAFRTLDHTLSPALQTPDPLLSSDPEPGTRQNPHVSGRNVSQVKKRLQCRSGILAAFRQYTHANLSAEKAARMPLLQ